MVGGVEIAIGFKKRRGVVFQIGNGVTKSARIDTFWVRKTRQRGSMPVRSRFKNLLGVSQTN